MERELLSPSASRCLLPLPSSSRSIPVFFTSSPLLPTYVTRKTCCLRSPNNTLTYPMLASAHRRVVPWRRGMTCLAMDGSEHEGKTEASGEEQRNIPTEETTQTNVTPISEPITSKGKDLSSIKLLDKYFEQNAGNATTPGGQEVTDKSSITQLENYFKKNEGGPENQGDTESLDQSSIPQLEKFLEKSDEGQVTRGDGEEKEDDAQIAAGSPFPGMKQLGESIRIPKATIDILKEQVFGFDSFFITSQEPYEGGVLFKGNLRGTAAKSYEKIMTGMQDKFGDEYSLFLLINPEDDKPVAVVVPRKTLQPESTAVPEWFAAATFGLVTVFTLLLRNVPALQSNLLSTFDNLGLLNDGLPGALTTLIVLGVHEVGHFVVAKDIGVKLGVPYFVPSWQVGSFGAITRIVNIVRNRQDLLKLAAAGPLPGFVVGFLLLFAGFILPPSDGIGIVIDPAVFHESFLVGGIAKLLLGDALKEGTSLSINPLVLWAWAGLLINAINSIPAGELDGGRIAFSLWGRKAGTRITSITLALLGVSSLFNDVAFYWVVLIFFLQRGPIAPLSEEITDPEKKYVLAGVAVLLLGLLICLPYPFAFTTEALNMVEL